MIEIDNRGVLWFKFNRPSVMNAINYEVMNEFEEMITLVKTSLDIKAVVITSSIEGIFCSGGDLSTFHKIKTEEEAFSMLSRMGNILVDIHFLPVPVIAYIDGPAVGGGCEIALACRYRIGSEKASFRFAQGRLGIITGWGGTTFLSNNHSVNNGLTYLLTGEKLTIYKLIEEKFVQMNLNYTEFNQWLSKLVMASSEVIRSYMLSYQSTSQIEMVRTAVLNECRRCAVLWEGEEHHRAVEEFLSKKKK